MVIILLIIIEVNNNNNNFNYPKHYREINLIFISKNLLKLSHSRIGTYIINKQDIMK